jgi:hypothetical protein
MTNYKELANALDKYDEDDKQRDEIAAILRGLDAQPVAEVSVMGSYHGKPILGCVLSNDSMQVGDKLYAAPVAAQPPSQPVDPVHVINTAIDAMMRRDATIAGVLFDFMGWLTTRKERLCLSSAADASPAVTAITEFAKMRSLSLDNAMVTDWQSGAAQASKPLRLGGPCRDHAHRTKDR